MTFGSYANFTVVPSKYILPVERPYPKVVAMLTSGLAASIALEKAGQMKFGEEVLVTAAAGGTGQFAVQIEMVEMQSQPGNGHLTEDDIADRVLATIPWYKWGLGHGVKGTSIRVESTQVELDATKLELVDSRKQVETLTEKQVVMDEKQEEMDEKQERMEAEIVDNRARLEVLLVGFNSQPPSG